MIRYIVKMFKALNANANPGEIAHAFSIALMLGFLPKNNLLWYLLFIFFLFVRINKGVFFILSLMFSFPATLLDPVFNTIGYKILTLPALEGFFSTLLEIPIVGFTRFNNTIVMGSFAASIVLYIPAYILGRLFVKLWRTTLAPKIRKNPVMKAFYKLPIVGKIKNVVSGE